MLPSFLFFRAVSAGSTTNGSAAVRVPCGVCASPQLETHPRCKLPSPHPRAAGRPWLPRRQWNRWSRCRTPTTAPLSTDKRPRPPLSGPPSFSPSTSQWLEILQRLCLHNQLSVQHWGLVITYNLLATDAELAKKLVESELLEILTIVGKQELDKKKAVVVQTARECLIKCMDYGFIKPVS